ncbi:MAG: HAMP domain-containing sensor histidine kinase [Thermodesulfovibrionales bacterium]
MRFFLLLFFFFMLPLNAWGYVPHDYPAIYTHQIARIFLFFAFLILLWAIVHNRLHTQKGWRYLYFSLILFIVWDLSVFVGRIAEILAIAQTIGSTEGWQYFGRSIKIGRLEYFYYAGRLDFILLNIAMLLFYLGLRELSQKVKEGSHVHIAVLLPLLPILITEITGNCIFIALSIMSLYESVRLYKTDKENVLWNYLVWLSASWFMYSISRSFGHILRHILIPTGNRDMWNFFEPITGSFNIFALFFVGSVSLFFISVYRSYLKVSEEKEKLEELVSERTRFIEQLEIDKVELQELDRMKSAFLTNMSHELRTPMNTIIGYTEVLLDKIDGDVNEEQEKSLKKVKESAKHLLQLIDNILNISKIESAKMRLEIREVSIRPLIESLISEFQPLMQQKGLRLSLDLSEKYPVVYGDTDKIKQILINLLSNAVKFTGEGGITVTTGTSDMGIKKGEPPQFMEISVEDTGIGIEEDDLGKIFDKFVQIDFTLVRQYEGTGLGLTIAKGLVNLHKGAIWVTSKYGRGSRFCFTLPLKKELLDN